VQADCVVKEYSVAETTTRVRQEKKTATGRPVLGPDGNVAMEEIEKVEAVETFKRDITARCPEESLFGHGEAGEPPAAPAGAHGAGHGAAEARPCWRVAYQPAVCKKDVGILVEYGDHEEREHTRIKAECKKSPKPPDAGDLLADRAQTLELGRPAIQPRHQLTAHEEHELEAMGPPPEHTNMFFTIYFAMTGLHGIHVLFGIGVFTWLLIRAIKGQFTPDYFGPIDYAALYWHIVDLIWIFLFPLLYLIH
jgi:hypothetical protein